MSAVEGTCRGPGLILPQGGNWQLASGDWHLATSPAHIRADAVTEDIGLGLARARARAIIIKADCVG